MPGRCESIEPGISDVVPAKAGTHTLRPLASCMIADGLRFQERLWLWVLTFVFYPVVLRT
jgi:hypothetical protein